MTIKRLAWGLGLLALGACSSAPASAPAPANGPAGSRTGMGGGFEGPGQTPVVFGLLGQRERLNLSSAQVTALDSIGEDLRVRNSSLMTHLRELRDSVGGGDRMNDRERTAYAERSRPTLEQLRTNNQAAMSAIQAVLTPAQQQTACEIQRESRTQRRTGTNARGGYGGNGGGAGGYGGGRMGGRGGMYGDSTMLRRQSGWAWCPADTTGRAARAAATRQ